MSFDSARGLRNTAGVQGGARIARHIAPRQKAMRNTPRNDPTERQALASVPVARYAIRSLHARPTRVLAGPPPGGACRRPAIEKKPEPLLDMKQCSCKTSTAEGANRRAGVAMGAGYCARWLRVLADETRLAVVQELLDGPRHVGEINTQLNVEQSLLSHHLQVLRRAGLVVSERVGKAVRYRLAPAIRKTAAADAIQLGCCQISFDRSFPSRAADASPPPAPRRNRSKK
jgi:ArsR family transcriptional regulator, nickel/cobalt-responsive transcriptional repressor